MKAEQLFAVSDLATIVTGGAGGLGFAIARALSDNGARVAIVDIDPAACAAATETLKERQGDVRFFVADVANRSSIQTAVDNAASAFGGLDVVFANAGIVAGPGFLTPVGTRDEAGALENVPTELWDSVIGVNLDGVFFTLQAAVPHLKARQGGRIVVTSSVASVKTSPTVGTPYLVTKAAVTHLVRQVAVELARDNILVNSIAPGPFLTRITTPELQTAFERNSPQKRAARPEEIEGLALLLASRASSFMTGAQFVIDGGSVLGIAD